VADFSGATASEMTFTVWQPKKSPTNCTHYLTFRNDLDKSLSKTKCETEKQKNVFVVHHVLLTIVHRT